MAGEFGHVQIDPLGPVCNCGRKGCWEVFASSRSAVAEYMKDRKMAAPVSIIEMMNLADEGDKKALAALMRQIKYLALGLRLITTALAPEVVFFTGGIASLWKPFLPLISKELENSAPFGEPPRIVVTNDAELSRLRGAATLVLQRHTGRPSSVRVPGSSSSVTVLASKERTRRRASK